MSEERPQKNSMIRTIQWLSAIGIVIAFHFQRLLNPTLLGDDVIRLVDARTLPFVEQLFRPFSEHVAPGFELATRALVWPLGDRLLLMPTAFTLVAMLSWMLFLGAVGFWIYRISGREDWAWMTFVMVGVSSACIEVPWWFSAATYSLSAAFVFLVLSVIATEQRVAFRRWLLIAFLTGLGMGFSALGLMTPVLGGLIVLLQSRFSRTTIQKGSAMIAGLLAYWLICRAFGENIISAAADNNRNMTDIPLGLAYALAVPGGVTVPLFAGIDAKYLTNSFSFMIAIPLTLVLIAFVAVFLRKSFIKWHVLTLLLAPYLVLYPTRAGLVSTGRWAEHDFLYFWTSRYHLFAIVGLSLLFAIAFSQMLQFISKSPRRSIVTVVLVVAYGVFQKTNQKHWLWMIEQADQRPTLVALEHLNEIAEREKLTQTELLQLFPPVRRGWNASVLELRPDAFPLVRLIADREKIKFKWSDFHYSDSEHRRMINSYRKMISGDDWTALTQGRLLNLCSTSPVHDLIAINDSEMKLEKAEHLQDTSWKINDWNGYLEFQAEFQNVDQLLYFQNIQTDNQSPVRIELSNDGKDWTHSMSGWLETKPGDNQPVPEWISISAVDLMIDPPAIWPQKIYIRIKPIMPCVLTIQKMGVGR